MTARLRVSTMPAGQVGADLRLESNPRPLYFAGCEEPWRQLAQREGHK
jgi:hypothetical protein